LSRWLLLKEWRPVDVLFGINGFFLALLVLSAAFESARRRWGVDSPRRRRLIQVTMVAYAISAVTRWPSGNWHYLVFAIWMAVFLVGQFWPERPQATA